MILRKIQIICGVRTSRTLAFRIYATNISFNSIYRGNIVTNLSFKVNNIAQVYLFNTIDRGNIAINISFQFISVWEYCPCYFLNMLIEATISLLFGYLATISLSWEVILVLTFFSFCLITHFI